MVRAKKAQAAAVAAIALFLIFLFFLSAFTSINNMRLFAVKEENYEAQVLAMQKEESLCVAYLPQSSQLVITNTGANPSTIVAVLELPNLRVISMKVTVQPGYSQQVPVDPGYTEYAAVTSLGNSFANTTTCS